MRDRIVVVTGGGRGIGRATAVACAREGAIVAVADIDLSGAESTVSLIAERKGQAIPIETDVSRYESVRAMVDQVLARYGGIDALVNNAAIVKHTPPLELSEGEWDEVLAINLKGTLLCCQLVARVMMPKRRGSIINLTSIAADLPTPDYVHYGVSKAGIKHLTKSFAVALGKHNIRVNAVAPGTIRTPMNEEALARPGAEASKLKIIALDHIGTPEEVADAIVFLASDDSRYVTGSVLYVDGGAVLMR